MLSLIDGFSVPCRPWECTIEGRKLLTFAGDALMASHDMKSAEKTYGGFISLLKWSVPVIAIITLFVIALIAE